ncbi:hypothetical protein BH11BAC6_BH11BAC6_12360 [soil metagenome]
MGEDAHRYFIINKPRNMLSQFVRSHEAALLGDLDFSFPAGTHAIGRLDSASEGLLLLTTNKKVTKLLFQGTVPHRRVYLVQVKNIISHETLEQLRTGVSIRIKGGGYYTTTPCDIQLVTNYEDHIKWGEKIPAHIPNSWLLITLTEGKYHQVRKMVKAVHHPCKRLIRIAIEHVQLNGLQPGEVKEIEEKDFFAQLRIEEW